MDFEACQPPADSISALEFSPGPNNMLCAGSWDHTVRIWNVEMNGLTTPQTYCKLNDPIMDISWSNDCKNVYVSTTGREVFQWDLQANRLIRVGVHLMGVRSCHWISSPDYCCLMTASWDKTIKFWDTRSQAPLRTYNLPDRCFAADMLYPMAAVACANKTIVTYSLKKDIVEFGRVESMLKQQIRCISIFGDKQAMVNGFVIGGIEGRAAVHYISMTKAPYTFKCHCTLCSFGIQNIYAVNDVKVHPVHRTVATVGSNGVFAFWDTDTQNKLYSSCTMEQSITKCCFNSDGQIFAYALGYDWAQGYEHYNPNKPPKICLHPCFEKTKPSA